MQIYVYKKDNMSYGFSPDLWNGDCYQVEVPYDFTGGNMVCDPITHAWTVSPTYVMTPEDYLKEAEITKKKLCAETITYINDRQWPSKLALGSMNDSDKNIFRNWLDYLTKLESMDVSCYPNIVFPQPPE